ncbi:hypothetical protein L1987_11798 [Smallanthus sonchifolius]|uniref:Uncharacterized protein n=1 Tax=Smallanthus sonchifolius TaxID=185202 RepID=A0ACB9JE89_9ASTR|nr:hypothetical protein L1987_11798 [Smallanthus sonchifolius]
MQFLKQPVQVRDALNVKKEGVSTHIKTHEIDDIHQPIDDDAVVKDSVLIDGEDGLYEEEGVETMEEEDADGSDLNDDLVLQFFCITVYSFGDPKLVSSKVLQVLPVVQRKSSKVMHRGISATRLHCQATPPG